MFSKIPLLAAPPDPLQPSLLVCKACKFREAYPTQRRKVARNCTLRRKADGEYHGKPSCYGKACEKGFRAAIAHNGHPQSLPWRSRRRKQQFLGSSRTLGNRWHRLMCLVTTLPKGDCIELRMHMELPVYGASNEYAYIRTCCDACTYAQSIAMCP